jgi:hypothetical protein
MDQILILKDELKYFIKSKFILYTSILVPLVLALIYFTSNGFGQIIMIFQMICIIASCIITANLITEIKEKVFVPFVTRAVKHKTLLFSRFFSVFISVLTPVILSIIFVLGLDYFYLKINTFQITFGNILNLAAMFICFLVYGSILGLIIGILISSLFTGILLTLFFSNIGIIGLYLLSDKIQSILKISSDNYIIGLIYVILSIIISIIGLKISEILFKNKML